MPPPDEPTSHTVLDGAAPGLAGGELARGTLLSGRFEIRRLLGRGGMGLVVHARDRALGEDVAVKLLRPEHATDARWVQRLAREVKLARQIRHRNVCRVFDFTAAGDQVFLVMELASGGALRAELDDGVTVPRPLAARLEDARAVAAGLAAIHAVGITHRDVTPQNLLRMADGRLVVSDFGLATDAAPAETTVRGGTLAYMAPEIARGEGATPASDVWSLGVIVHELVFGRRPSWRDGRWQPALATPANAPLSRQQREVIDLCRRCLAPARARRPSAAQAAAALGDMLARGAGGARTGSRRARVALVAAAAAVAIAGGIWRLRHWRGAAAAQQTASADTSRALALPISGVPDDWTDSARVVATFDGRVMGVTALPDGGSVRVVWGDPARVEEVELATGRRTPVDIAGWTATAGVPTTSGDGSATVFEGYDTAGRPFVFMQGGQRAEAPAVPLTAAADPSLSSQPRWLHGSRAFVYDADSRNAGVFSLETNRATILPDFPSAPFFTVFKAAVHDRVLVTRVTEALRSQIAVFSWPALQVQARFDLAAHAFEWVSRDGHNLIAIAAENAEATEILAVDPAVQRARRAGVVRDRSLRGLALAGAQLVFAAYRFEGDVWLEEGGGGGAAAGRLVTHGLQARELGRGGGHLLVAARRRGRQVILDLDESGAERAQLTDGPYDDSPSVLPGGAEWLHGRRQGDRPGHYRCRFDTGRCRRIADHPLPYATVSPDGRRVAYLQAAPHVIEARWMPIEGGPSHVIGDASSFCAPVWSSTHTIWLSRRTGAAPQWVELDALTSHPTGRTQPGLQDCTEYLPDPAAPARDGAKIVVRWVSELRVHEAP